MSQPPSAPAAEAPKSWNRPWVAAGIMVGLALVGIALATASPSFAPRYWIAMVPVYGLLCTLSAWQRSKESGEKIVVRQILHWLGIAGALALDFLLPHVGLESGMSTGLDALLLLALGSYLAGVHLAWPFYGVGLILTGVLVAVATAEQYLWLILLAAVAAGALAVVLRHRARSGGAQAS